MSLSARERLFELCVRGTAHLSGREVLLMYFVGEESDFVRFNRARVRQAMTIRQGHLTLSLIDGARRDTTTLTLTGDLAEDAAAVVQCIGSMRDGLGTLPEDPYLLYSREPSHSDRVDRGRLPTPAEAVDAITSAGKKTDLVGLYASGPIQRGFASSLGHRHWHEVDSFQFDWSLYQSRDKAVSRSYAAASFDEPELRARMQSAEETCLHLAKPARTIEPGTYRAYLTPAAVAELFSMLNWAGVSEKAERTKTSCIQQLADGEVTLSPKMTLRENTAQGLSPSFDDVGFEKPGNVDLVVEGRHAGALVGPRTAREYGIVANADAEEAMRSVDVAAGTLPDADVLAALDTGVYVGNLWYLNFSDRSNARITGMTRFATFWVEHGNIVAPLNVMRFDDTLYRMLGENLIDLTRERDFIQSTSTYGQRSVESGRFPGALLGAVALTL